MASLPSAGTRAAPLEESTREQLARLDRRRKKKASNKEWTSPSDPDARIAKMKDGRTHLAHKADHAVDLASGAIVAVTLQAADQGDTATIGATLKEAPANAKLLNARGVEGVVADKGYHSGTVLVGLAEESVRSYIPEPERGRRQWAGKRVEQQRVYTNRRRLAGASTTAKQHPEAAADPGGGLQSGPAGAGEIRAEQVAGAGGRY